MKNKPTVEVCNNVITAEAGKVTDKQAEAVIALANAIIAASNALKPGPSGSIHTGILISKDE